MTMPAEHNDQAAGGSFDAKPGRPVELTVASKLFEKHPSDSSLLVRMPIRASRASMGVNCHIV